MFDCPISSPKITRMFGFAALGCWASAGERASGERLVATSAAAKMLRSRRRRRSGGASTLVLLLTSRLIPYSLSSQRYFAGTASVAAVLGILTTHLKPT